MRLAFRFVPAVALLSLLASLPARAEQNQVQAEVGGAPICDTQKQVERFVALYDGNAQNAANAVNAEEKDPTACVFATVAFVRGPEIATTRTRDGTYRIIRILVLGVVTAAGMQATPPAAFYSVIRVEERDA